MADAVRQPAMAPDHAEFLPEWMCRQRWYGGKGRLPRLRPVGSLSWEDPQGRVGIHSHLVLDEAAPEPVLYQVPLTYREAPLAGAESALVGRLDGPGLGTRYVYDGCHDHAFASALLQTILTSGRVPGTPAGATEGEGQRHAMAPDVEAGTSRVLSGEQSNTSIIVDCVDRLGLARPLICKVFRVVQTGENPDVVVQSALAEAGSQRVPGMVGALGGRWGTGAYGHLAFAQEFYPGTEDAWRVALRAVSDAVPFTAEAAELGAATAEVHDMLAEVLPTEQPTAEAVAQTVAGMRRRYVAAASEVPALAAHERHIARVFDRAAGASWPALQRIHGDYHLGQVLRVRDRGWVLLDFEGEPLRPLAERTRPDLPVRDIAGMLRSFDYAAGSWEQTHPGGSARAWARDAELAFLDGYAAAAGRDPREDGDLLAAFLLDKALYEVVYEARNRPTWLTIPTDAVARLLDETRKVSA
jgi:maltokinase